MQDLARARIGGMAGALPGDLLQAVLKVEPVLLAETLAEAFDIFQPAIIDKGVALLDAEGLALLGEPLLQFLGARIVLHVEVFHVLDVPEKEVLPLGTQYDEHAFELVQVPPKNDCIAAVARREKTMTPLVVSMDFLKRLPMPFMRPSFPLKLPSTKSE